MKKERAPRIRIRRDDRGEGPVGYLMVAAVLGMLGVGLAPLMQGEVAQAFAGVLTGLLEGVGGIFGL